MIINPILVAMGLVLAVAAAASGVQAGSLKPDDPAALKRTRSLGRIIADTRDKPVHVLFVHGMRAEGAGNARTFMAGLCKHGKVKCPPGQLKATERHVLPLGAAPPARLFGKPVWREGEWEANPPFVDRYVFERDGAPPVVVDEVNWWPLLFPLKCRALVAPEAALSGIDKKHVELCHTEDPGRRLHAWIDDVEYAEVMKGAQISGGGAWANASLKQQIMNWGLADAVIALGPMRVYFRKAMDEAFRYAGGFDAKGVDGQEFVVVSESLGSFVVMDAATNRANDAPNARAVVGATSSLYFFANQFALLELGRVRGLPASFGLTDRGETDNEAVQQDLAPMDMLSAWTKGQLSNARLVSQPRQIIAFSDPSDMLTFNVPSLPGERDGSRALVVNIYDRNAINWFGVFVNPGKAHTGHSSNKAVLKQMFTP